jgi:hypothetical protein
MLKGSRRKTLCHADIENFLKDITLPNDKDKIEIVEKPVSTEEIIRSMCKVSVGCVPFCCLCFIFIVCLHRYIASPLVRRRRSMKYVI